jgi:lipopolysaccharide biosynthesis glycosyltransferase
MTLVEIKPREIIRRFIDYCNKLKGWQTYGNEDLVQVKNSFHQLIWTQNLMPETFKSVVMDPSCTIQSRIESLAPFDYVEPGISQKGPYRMVRVSFMAWVLPKQPSIAILEFFEKKPQIQNRVALYDLSRFFRSEPICAKLNKTKSPVFDEFESFLINCYGTKFELVSPLRSMNQ